MAAIRALATNTARVMRMRLKPQSFLSLRSSMAVPLAAEKKEDMVSSMKRFDYLCEEEVSYQERIDRYNEVAHAYDKDSEVLEWIGPKLMAKAVMKHCPDRNISILDVCAGTGHVAEELHKHGYTSFDLLDGSIEMVKIALKTKLYSRSVIQLISDDITKPTIIRKEGMCIVVTWAGEVTEEELQNMINTLNTAEKEKKCKVITSERIKQTSLDGEGRSVGGSIVVWQKN